MGRVSASRGKTMSKKLKLTARMDPNSWSTGRAAKAVLLAVTQNILNRVRRAV